MPLVASWEVSEAAKTGEIMRYLKYFALLGILVGITALNAPAQVSVGVGIGLGYVAGPPVCSYGYYNYYPYDCAPYGYYGPDYFVSGVFIGAGPWYHGYYGPRYYGRGYYGRGYYGHGYYGRGYYGGRGGWDRGRGWDRGYRGGNWGGRGFQGGGGGFHHGGGFHGHR